MFAPAREGTFEPGNEARIHADELVLGIGPEPVIGLGRRAHERVGTAIEITRRAAAPPSLIVGHRYVEQRELNSTFDATPSQSRNTAAEGERDDRTVG